MFTTRVRHILFIAALGGWPLVSWFLAKEADEFRSKHVEEQGLVPIGGTVVEISHGSRHQPLECEFPLYNPTSEPISIRRVETGCSCSVASVNSATIGPGERFSLRIKVASFPMDSAEAKQIIRVETSSPKSLFLEIHVHLPLPTQTVFRPQVVYLDPLAGEALVTRTVGIRVPKQCARPLTDADIIKVNCPQVHAELATMPPSDMYFEYQLRVRIKSIDKVSSDARLRLNTGCNPISIELRQWNDRR